MLDFYSDDIKHLIMVLEKNVFCRRFPKCLREYLIETYKYGPWPFGYREGELEGMIYQDAKDYFNGKLDTTIEPLIDRAFREIKEARGNLEQAVEKINDLENYIDELHKMLWDNGIEESYDLPKDEPYPVIIQDARELINGRFDTTTMSPDERASDEVDHVYDCLDGAIRTIYNLEDYINDLHELLWANGLEGSRMLHDETGEHKGTYAEFDTICPEELE